MDEDNDMDGETLYCICRTADSERFMIGCDHCEEWYHGDCIGITAEDARHIKRYYCDACIGHEEIWWFQQAEANVSTEAVYKLL
ncbi:CXXC-type zinc finger protein 1 [Elysia marginata]|uniref:CXXC-type zinc finger protein 1 n=1 Tax=Elysia marginata TaxID=1093978 RepID=A0AAV4GBA7_9GAST|nr:CXXC-type zinc finger protein 1 [Elysia marginata]